MPTIITVVGARPQFIKAAPVSQALAATGRVREILVHTGQHFDDNMSKVFFDELGIAPPDHYLGIHGGDHGEMTGRMLIELEAVLTSTRPDAVLVYGDTNSTLAAALAASKMNIPVGHVEAGLRSFNRAMPEEINRVVADHLSEWLFCPTTTAVKNLAREGIVKGVRHTGDVMYDATVAARRRALERSTILERLDLAPGGYGLATVHRAENTDDPARLAEVFRYLEERAAHQPIVLPLHPRTRARLKAAGMHPARLRLCEPVGYLDMNRLLADAEVVYTDSGGLQKEAYFHRVPCVTLREETEWVETIECGWNRLWRTADYAEPRDIDEYGDGTAATVIATALAASLEGLGADT